jgi:RNA polymerase sigma-70 factor (ECF subfamily)
MSATRPWDTDLEIFEDEAALLEGFRQHDPYACSCMLKRYAPRLYRLALRITRDADAAEDVLQEAFIRSCDRIDEFEGLSSLNTWLHRIVVNSALMHLRRAETNRSAQALDIDAVPASGEDLALADTRSEPGAELVSGELRDAIEATVMALPDTLRTAFVLRELEGLSTADTAAALGIGESAVKVRLHRARAALRTALGPYLDTTNAEDA